MAASVLCMILYGMSPHAPHSPRSQVPPFYDPQELFALPVDIIDGYLILLGRVQPTFTGGRGVSGSASGVGKPCR